MDKTRQEIFEYANKLRVAKRLNPFAYDERLEKAAQPHADLLQAGRAHPHDRLAERIRDGGFPQSRDCLISRRSMMASYTEGISSGSASLEMGANYIDYLLSGGPSDDHVKDFYDKLITHIGIGYSKNHLVIDYGRLCEGEPSNDTLNENNFSIL